LVARAGRAAESAGPVRDALPVSGGAALTAGAGSIGIIGAARVGWTAGPHPDPEAGVQVLAVSKTNLGPVPKPLAYEVRPVPIPGAPPNRLGRIPTRSEEHTSEL